MIDADYMSWRFHGWALFPAFSDSNVLMDSDPHAYSLSVWCGTPTKLSLYISLSSGSINLDVIALESLS